MRYPDGDAGPRRGPSIVWLAAFAVSMAFLESAVVVYLRLLYYPDGFVFPLRLIEPRVGAIEVAREATTLVMILSASWLAAADTWRRFLSFSFIFGVWDVFYYAWLVVLMDWPPSLLTWDILFLIPVPWASPVLAPLLVSLCLISGSLMMFRRLAAGARPDFPWWLWGAAVTGGILVLVSFMIDFRILLEGGTPPPFRWGLFLAGLGLSAAAAVFGINSLTIRLGSRHVGGDG